MNEPAQDLHARRFAMGDRVLLVVAVAISAWVYHPITENYFYGDDFLHLYRIVNEGFVDFVVRPHGGHVLLVRNALFYLFHWLFGTNAEAYFWVVLATHLVNVGLLYAVIRLFTGSTRLACFGAVLWGIAPCNRGTLGWYSVYGQAVVVTCTLIVLYGLGRLAAGAELRRFTMLAWALLLLAAATSFGVGIGMALVMPFVAFLLLPPSAPRVKIIGSLLLVAAVVPPLYFGLQRMHVLWFEGNEQSISFLWAGLAYENLIAKLTIHLTGYGITNLVSGALHSPLYYPGPIGYAIVAGFATVVVVGMVRGPARTRRQIVGFFLLAIACYGMIGLGRGVFFDSPGRLGLIRAVRFQYLGPMGLTLTLCAALAGWGTWLSRFEKGKSALLATWLVAAVALEYQMGAPIVHYPAARRETKAAISTLRSAIDTAPPGKDLYFESLPFRSTGPILTSPTLFPGWAAVFTIFFPNNVIDGKRVHFVVDDDKAVAIAGRGRRTADLIVSTSEARQRNVETIDPRKVGKRDATRCRSTGLCTRTPA